MASLWFQRFPFKPPPGPRPRYPLKTHTHTRRIQHELHLRFGGALAFSCRRWFSSINDLGRIASSRTRPGPSGKANFLSATPTKASKGKKPRMIHSCRNGTWGLSLLTCSSHAKNARMPQPPNQNQPGVHELKHEVLKPGK